MERPYLGHEGYNRCIQSSIFLESLNRRPLGRLFVEQHSAADKRPYITMFIVRCLSDDRHLII
jgi:hypothetical protein